jgi:RNA recognition motif-containing protein
MPNNSEADDAIRALNDSVQDGRKLTVNEARPRNERPPKRF